MLELNVDMHGDFPGRLERASHVRHLCVKQLLSYGPVLADSELGN